MDFTCRIDTYSPSFVWDLYKALPKEARGVGIIIPISTSISLCSSFSLLLAASSCRSLWYIGMMDCPHQLCSTVSQRTLGVVSSCLHFWSLGVNFLSISQGNTFPFNIQILDGSGLMAIRPGPEWHWVFSFPAPMLCSWNSIPLDGCLILPGKASVLPHSWCSVS